ncbi:AI-2E family transporter [Demequina sp.]|uniref:AI-2E family transporter n=1 Tax=Demequina sp. TaxID=2050685 RepID=UPI003D0AC1E5
MVRLSLRPSKKSVDGADGAPAGSIPYGFVLTAAWAWRLIAIGIVALAALSLFATLSTILMPMIIALIIAAPLEHLVTRMEKHHIPRGAGAAIVILTLVVLVLGLLVAAGGTIAAGFEDLRVQAVEGFNTFLDWLVKGPFHVDPTQITEWQQKAQDFLTKNWLGVANGALSVTGTIGAVFAGAVIALLSLFFFLKDGRLMWLWGVKHTTGDNADRVDNAGTAAWGTLGRYARTSAFVAMIDAVGIGIGAWILGLPLVIPIAILVFLFSFVPMFGAAISGAIAVLIALVDGDWVKALIMLGIVILVQQLEGSILYPLMFGKAASLHPMVILLSVSAGTLLAGFIGAVIAVPFISFITTFITKLRDPDAPAPGEEEEDGESLAIAPA